MKRLFALSALALMGNTPPPDAIPAPLAPYIVDGALKTDDFGWMRGAFDGATEQQKADLANIKKWLQKCKSAAKEEAVTALAQLGVANPRLDDFSRGSGLCTSVSTYIDMGGSSKDWGVFRADEVRAREVFSIYQFGANTARLHGAYEPNWGSAESWYLLRATVMEQVYRIGTDWQADKDAPAVSPTLHPYLRAHMLNAAQISDRKNTAFLKKLVTEKGWPSIPMVGERASFNAWLLVQHADHDPAFQLTALRLMEPLARKGEVSKRNYAYLYDRIMLKLHGKQRFGTQFSGCDGTQYRLQPLEDEAALDSLRQSHELEPISEYKATMFRNNGPCKEQ